jgi:hypothetical protein
MQHTLIKTKSLIMHTKIVTILEQIEIVFQLLVIIISANFFFAHITKQIIIVLKTKATFVQIN